MEAGFEQHQHVTVRLFMLLACVTCYMRLDCETGEKKWHADFKNRFDSPLPAFGFASSPLVQGDAIFVQAGGGFLKLNKKTGETIWRTATDGGGMFGSAFQLSYHYNTTKQKNSSGTDQKISQRN
jgi:outer membrane protein assembly factor BamB